MKFEACGRPPCFRYGGGEVISAAAEAAAATRGWGVLMSKAAMPVFLPLSLLALLPTDEEDQLGVPATADGGVEEAAQVILGLRAVTVAVALAVAAEVVVA